MELSGPVSQEPSEQAPSQREALRFFHRVWTEVAHPLFLRQIQTLAQIPHSKMGIVIVPDGTAQQLDISAPVFHCDAQRL